MNEGAKGLRSESFGSDWILVENQPCHVCATTSHHDSRFLASLYR